MNPPPLHLSKVAVIESHAALRKMFTELVNGKEEYHCVCACSSSKEALVQVPKHQPDVVLMDTHLPDESGIVCTARLTKLMPDLLVIMVTIYADTGLIFQSFKAGACGYILKHSSPEAIIQAIAEVRAGGAPMTPEIARRVVRSFRPASRVPEMEGLTAREAQIVEQLAKGLSNKEIGVRMNIAAGTVRNHLGNIFGKLRVRSRTEAAAKYLHAKSDQ